MHVKEDEAYWLRRDISIVLEDVPRGCQVWANSIRGIFNAHPGPTQEEMSERERRIEAATEVLMPFRAHPFPSAQKVPALAESILNAADDRLIMRAERAEAAERDLKSQLGGIAGTLDTPTSLFGRDEATQIAEFRRRVAQAVSMLDHLAGIDIQRHSKSADWPSFSGCKS